MWQAWNTGSYHIRGEALFMPACPYLHSSNGKIQNCQFESLQQPASVFVLLTPISPSIYILTNILKRSNQVDIKYHTPSRELDWCTERCGVTHRDVVSLECQSQSPATSTPFLLRVLPQTKQKHWVFTFFPQLLSFVSILTQGLFEWEAETSTF